MRSYYLCCLALAIQSACSTDGGSYPLPAEEDPPVGVDRDSGASTAEDGGVTTDAAMMCVPDLAPTAVCGRCGTASQACVDGRVEIGACAGEHGECKTGDTIYTPDKCQYRVCTEKCAWPGWSKAPGVECSHDEQCNAGVSCPRVGVRQCVMCKFQKCACPP
jgi:hypothetical protein